ncbi:hypothetical protein HY504_01060 [Candidatus Wolfebacteria bacterium]|nr:hypothetical protein [Candidatus Wolfebacteria bacterium]
MKKQTSKMTIDRLAQMSQREFTAIHEEMGEGFNRIDGDVRLLRRDMEEGFSAVSQSMKVIIDKLNAIQRDVIEIHDLRGRVERLEKKVGFR